MSINMYTFKLNKKFQNSSYPTVAVLDPAAIQDLKH